MINIVFVNTFRLSEVCDLFSELIIRLLEEIKFVSEVRIKSPEDRLWLSEDRFRVFSMLPGTSSVLFCPLNRQLCETPNGEVFRPIPNIINVRKNHLAFVILTKQSTYPAN